MKGDSDPRSRTQPRILWGRVAFFGVALVLAFALGAWSAADDTAEVELEEARAEIERLAQENVGLRAENEALAAGEALEAEAASEQDEDVSDEADADDQVEDTDGPEESEPPGDDDTAEGESTVDTEEPGTPGDDGSAMSSYVVQQGDTGHDIAETVYGDRDLWPLIADANDLEGANALQVDQELVIPPSE